MKTEADLIAQFNADTSPRNRFKVCRALNEMFPKRSMWKDIHPTSYRYAMEHKCVPTLKTKGVIREKISRQKTCESVIAHVAMYRDTIYNRWKDSPAIDREIGAALTSAYGMGFGVADCIAYAEKRERELAKDYA
jgi:hypothetical protein